MSTCLSLKELQLVGQKVSRPNSQTGYLLQGQGMTLDTALQRIMETFSFVTSENTDTLLIERESEAAHIVM